MDDHSTAKGKSQKKLRSSLVERAAERLAADARKSMPRKDGRTQAPGSHRYEAATQVKGEHQHLLENSEGQEPLAEFGSEPAAMPLALSDTLLPSRESVEVQKGKTRLSRMVDIELGSLMLRKIITPETKRNRTLEEFRLIKRTVLSRRWDESDLPGNTIVVTSALPSEGKTTTAINLAMSIAAEEDLRVVLVDADFIKPDALRQLGVKADKGLIDVLRNPNLDISDVMLRTNIEKLSLIPAGQPDDHCTELLASAKMDDLITELAGRYDDRILIFDSPPILVTTESVVLASHMGQLVFVVQAGRTKRESLLSALDLIGDRPHLGLVLNRTSGRLGNTDFGAYYGSYYSYGYGQDVDGGQGAASER
jgi:receptor protein-tyrosine kinase